MDRLTKHWGNNAPVPTKYCHEFVLDMNPDELKGYTDILQRLSDYEDTGLEPGEVIQFMALFTYMMNLWQEMRDQALLDHLREVCRKEDLDKIKTVGGMAQPNPFSWEDKPLDNEGYVAEARYDTILF